MTAHVQPDLFGDFDREEEARARAAEERERERQPATCAACGITEPNGWALSMNHGYNRDGTTLYGFPAGKHPIYGARCTAQYLVTNHITYAARHDDEQLLAERMERGRELGLDVDAIAAEARAEAAR